jgi:hypothetical protein
VLLASNDPERAEVIQELEEVNALRSRALALEIGVKDLQLLHSIYGAANSKCGRLGMYIIHSVSMFTHGYVHPSYIV